MYLFISSFYGLSIYYYVFIYSFYYGFSIDSFMVCIHSFGRTFIYPCIAHILVLCTPVVEHWNVEGVDEWRVPDLRADDHSSLCQGTNSETHSPQLGIYCSIGMCMNGRFRDLETERSVSVPWKPT